MAKLQHFLDLTLFGIVLITTAVSLIGSCDLNEGEKCMEDIKKIYQEKGTNAKEMKIKLCQIKIQKVQNCLKENIGSCPDAQKGDVDRIRGDFSAMWKNITETCEPGCENLSSRSKSLGNCAIELSRKLPSAENKESLCSVFKVMMNCAKSLVGKCSSLRRVYAQHIIPLEQLMEPHCSTASKNMQGSIYLVPVLLVLVDLIRRQNIGCYG